MQRICTATLMLGALAIPLAHGLDKVKAGEKVRFAADKIRDAFTITEIESAK